ncbi:MAG: transcriptional repressor [Candidatus Moranbacteria bacterium]|nr:transcriptional repressor [Candidatus Moranbacteria bacterium]MBP6034422.1 transcriptional repressor [Candidatus Moranbacteria bacterium]MBP7695705.1 transcriptional repressor [Candidatus Moranbacteria bacterium]
MEKSREFLRTRGLRETRARVAILGVFLSAPSPVSVPDVFLALADIGQVFNKTTLYRELEFLAAEGIVSGALSLGSCQYYELAREHHHHLVCTSCGTIQDIEAREDLCRFEHELWHEKGFRVARHSMEFFGICQKCLI